MKYHKPKLLVTITMVLACLTVFAVFPNNAQLAIARIVVAIFAMVITKITVEYLISRRQKEKDANHRRNDHVA